MIPVRVLNAVLALLLAAIWGLIVVSRPDHTRRNFRWLPQMEDPLAFETQKHFLPGVDRRLAGAAIPGTVARGAKPLPAGVELSNPLKPVEAELLRGEKVFAAYCFPCHGPAGLGDGPVTRRGVPAPPSLLGEKAVTMSDGRMFAIITEGQKNMAAYAAQIGRDDRWRAVLRVRALQAAAKPKPKEKTR